ncbi:MAG: hypothetical protein HYU97_05220 [Deltaproteobacteria bacterium]|nr:hypothetical protein [Deltaproteobacteria bacterium]
MNLKQEQVFFEGQKEKLLQQHEGQFVLIKNQKIHGFFTTEQEAYEKGIELFGAQEMFIKQILKKEPKHFIPAFSTTPHAHL